MLQSFRILLMLLLSASLVACTTTRVIAKGQGASAAVLRDPNALGDPKRMAAITITDGTRYELLISSVDADFVTGTSLDQTQPIRIPVSQVERVEVADTETRTILIALGIVLAVAVVAALATANSVGKSLATVAP